MKSISSLPPQSIVKFLKHVQYDNCMFSPININESHKAYLRIKPFKNREYIFLKQKRIITADELISGATYIVEVNSWLHNGMVYSNFHFKLKDMPISDKNTRKPKCLFIEAK